MLSLQVISKHFKGKKLPVNERWPDIGRYYGKKWIHWAILADLQRFSYTGIDAFGEIQRFRGRLFRRWSDYRRKRNLALIYSFCDAENIPTDWNMHFLTLTVQHPHIHTYNGQKQTIDDIRKAWGRFRFCLRGMRYMRVLEAGEQNGYCHIHMILYAPPDKDTDDLPQKWIECCHKIGNEAKLAGQNIQRCENVQNVGAYVSKYLSKTLETPKNTTDDTNYWRWMEMCYHLRLRCVSMDAKSRLYIARKYITLGISGVSGEWMPLDKDRGNDDECGGGGDSDSAWVPLAPKMINVAVDDHLLPKVLRFEDGEVPDDADVLIPRRLVSSGVLAMLRGFDT